MSSLEHLAEPAPTVIESGALRIRTAPGADSCLVSLEGELDLESASTLELELRRLLDAGLASIAVDLEGLEFVDSTGLQSLVRIAREAADRDEIVSFTRPHGAVAKLFRLTGLSEALRFA